MVQHIREIGDPSPAAGPVAPAPLRPRLRVPDLIGVSPAIQRLRDEVRKIATSEAETILVQGESGTGKDLVTKVIHAESPRAPHPFVPINCSAVPENLLEAELFGHEPGAYTDARKVKRGLLELAHRGTAFLDEVAELSLAMQAKFLRFLEDRSFRRLGGTADIAVDVRVVAGTNVDLADAVREGRFRSDLYYRLRVVPVTVPPLRERPEDVPVLARFFLEHYARKLRKHFEEIDVEAMRVLVAHPWPGNVRELKNTVERIVLLEEGPRVTPGMLLLGEAARPATAAPPAEDLSLVRLELRALVRALELSGGNQTRAARLLGISRDTVRYRMTKHGIRTETRVIVERPSGA